MTTTQFSSLSLSAEMLSNLQSLGYSEMTPIQAQSLPIILQGRDLIAKAKTGSGKTAAFGIGLLAQLNVKKFAIQSLVLCPTRELADQVAKEIRRIARATHNVKVLTLCGGVSIGPQLGSLEHGAHIIVGTPGRILDHIDKGSLKLENLKQLVLDEADRMLDMGFADAIKIILDACPKERQTLLFSATYPDEIKKISAHCQKDPQEVSVESIHGDAHIEQHFYELRDGERKSEAVQQLLAHFKPQSCIIFCNTKVQCQEVCDLLRDQRINALALHGDLEQKERDQVLVRFANRSCPVLIATDVAARGIDIKGLDAVINVELAHDSEVHVHRIGRTGRAGESGLALSLIAPNELGRLNRLEDYLQKTLLLENLPSVADHAPAIMPDMVTLCIDGGKKEKVRPGDIIGALTKEAGLEFEKIGKIDIFEFCAYVAVHQSIAKEALQHLQNGKIKGRKFRARKL
ncbi:MAG: ATP-dependent RNA helicase DbpA [Gammaproteobacteria bacterium]|nr:MAG: ATP-dependent RNA helicase DbpA [Gammaproteobacteria bacterium]